MVDSNRPAVYFHHHGGAHGARAPESSREFPLPGLVRFLLGLMARAAGPCARQTRVEKSVPPATTASPETMKAMTHPDETARIRQTLLRPYRFASVLAAAALLVSLAFLAYTAWSTARRLDPIERHLGHLQSLQEVSIAIQELLVRHMENDPPAASEIAGVSKQLKDILDSGNQLHPDTPRQLNEARKFLDADNGNRQAGLLAALTLIRQTLRQENGLQRNAVADARKAARTEFLTAAIALLLAPLSSLLLLGYIRHRSFRSLETLSRMLENVGNLDFRTWSPPAPDDPLADVFARYNSMTEKLRRAQDETREQHETLESQVRMASETLLRQQSELAEGARLAALGEFSARVAHELRNPISGIALALRNLEGEMTDHDQRERVRLVVDEMDRVSRLLNALLEQAPGSPEPSTPIEIRSLVDGIVRLFHYRLPEGVEVRFDIDEQVCTLPPDTLRQILLNLLRNAAEALDGRTGHIDIAMHCKDGTATLMVADDGPGYPPDLLKLGIRPFHSGKARGTGLGLSVIQRLARSAGGDIRLSRTEEGGACATVTLPCEA